MLDFKNASNINKKDFESFLMLGRAYIKLGEKEKAYDAMEAAVELDKENLSGRYFRGIARARYGDLLGAVLDLSYYLKENEDDTNALYNRAICYIGEGFYAGSIRDFTRLLELEPDNDRAAVHRAISYARTGNTNTACQELSRLAKKGDATSIRLLEEFCR